MASYHITDNGPRACSTTPDRCPYGREGGDHFDNIAEAQGSYEKIMEARYGASGLSQAAGNRQTELYSLYSGLESTQRDSDIHRKIAQLASYSRSAPSKQPRNPPQNTGRGKGHERMRRARRSVAKLSARRGQELFDRATSTPPNIVRLQGYLTRASQSIAE